MTASLAADARTTLEDQIAELDGVLHVSVDPRTDAVWVVRDPGYDLAPIELAVRNRIASLGYDPTSFDVKVTLPAAAGPRRRVRFVDVQRAENHGRVTITVRLEWNDVVHTGEVTGEKGFAIEQKTAAHAALQAIEALSGQQLSLRIIGVKIIHAFDSDLMVASLLRSDGDHQRLVGAVVVSGDVLSAAALAVLSALNRTLGNFLHTPD